MHSMLTMIFLVRFFLQCSIFLYPKYKKKIKGNKHMRVHTHLLASFVKKKKEKDLLPF